MGNHATYIDRKEELMAGSDVSDEQRALALAYLERREALDLAEVLGLAA